MADESVRQSGQRSEWSCGKRAVLHDPLRTAEVQITLLYLGQIFCSQFIILYNYYIKMSSTIIWALWESFSAAAADIWCSAAGKCNYVIISYFWLNKMGIFPWLLPQGEAQRKLYARQFSRSACKEFQGMTALYGHHSKLIVQFDNVQDSCLVSVYQVVLF